MPPFSLVEKGIFKKLIVMHPNIDDNTRAGIAGGVLLTIIVNIQYGEVLKTAVLAAVGAVVSFCVSLLLKMIVKRFRKR
jgi:hypothetical protein